jgi:hypothetical protein
MLHCLHSVPDVFRAATIWLAGRGPGRCVAFRDVLLEGAGPHRKAPIAHLNVVSAYSPAYLLLSVFIVVVVVVVVCR